MKIELQQKQKDCEIIKEGAILVFNNLTCLWAQTGLGLYQLIYLDEYTTNRFNTELYPNDTSIEGLKKSLNVQTIDIYYNSVLIVK